MLRRQCGSITVPVGMGPSSLTEVARCMTSRGQFNPIHAFTAQSMSPEKRATKDGEFHKMITNPGPLRVHYSPDYVDWLQRAYQAKVKFADDKAKAAKVFNGLLLTEQQGTNGIVDQAVLPGAPPPGHCLRPAHSARRQAGEARRAAAQTTLDRVAKQQGVLDLFERQPQFPAIHIDKASRFHLVELFHELVLDRALEAQEIWDKALLYRAILTERKAAYPSTFAYIFDSVEATALGPAALPGVTTEAVVPSLDAYQYFLYLVRRYYIDNAVEGHVVLRCHRSPNASELLFSVPPPKDEQEVLRSIFAVEGGEGGNASSPRPQRLQPPSSYPPIEALWRCEENVPLLRVLLFGEMNLMVSENPFARFPNAQAYLTRPDASVPSAEGSGGAAASASASPNRSNRRGGRQGDENGTVPLSSIIAEKRGHLMSPLARNLAMSLDGRANDVRRLQQRHQREDAAAFNKVLRGPDAEENPGSFSAYSDWTYFNPRAVRAEQRDMLSREALDALKVYDHTSKDIYRVGYEEVEMNNATRPVEGANTAPSYIPTLPHFASIIQKDPHVAFLSHVALPEAYNTHHGVSVDQSKKRLEELVLQLARALHLTALEFHKEKLRRMHRQKVLVAASLLDNFVSEQWRTCAVGGSGGAGQVSEVAGMARRLGTYVPFEGRILDESGFPSDARVEDYTRWMRAPTA